MRLARTCITIGSLAAALAACGAKTGLYVPDVVADVPDVGLPDVANPPDVADVQIPSCRTGAFTLTPRAADVILVVDRSGSMSDPLNRRGGFGAPSKWSLLRDALSATLPAFQDRIDVGALFFPDANASPANSCVVANIPDVDVDPGTGNTDRVLRIFHTTDPNGDTPTAAALLRAYDWFVRNPNRARSRYLVLATDGGPNCNPALDSRTCACTVGAGPGGTDLCVGHPLSCLDSARTIGEIQQIASNPVAAIPTFVIGLAGGDDPAFTATLTAMAIAGGRPNTTSGIPSFFDVEQPGDLGTAFTAIQNTIARCAFVTPSRPDTPNGLTLTLDGVSVPRDTTRMNGWDWTDQVYGEITLFGAACVHATEPMPALVATVECTPDGG